MRPAGAEGYRRTADRLELPPWPFRDWADAILGTSGAAFVRYLWNTGARSI